MENKLIEQNNAIYADDFSKFLSHTDEKKVLFEKVAEKIKENNARSLLDIGAGNGLLAIPLSKVVDKYVAIEPHPGHARTLKAEGLEVMEGRFPDIVIAGSFDAILASHVVSYKDASYVQFIDTAWECLNPGGILIIITHKGEENEWTDLLNEVGLSDLIYTQSIIGEIKEKLSQLGRLVEEKIVTHIMSKNINDIIDALRFVASDAEPALKARFDEKRQKVAESLERQYRKNNEYSFPFSHFMLVTKK